jgi:hypothetical protein
MKVINFWGGPGSGKSTTAAHLFALLKWRGVNCELSREWIKEKVWQDVEHPSLDDQLYVFAKQRTSLVSLDSQVEYAITDSPLLLSLIYAQDKSEVFANLIVKYFKEFDNINYFVERVKPYNPKGRVQTFEESKEIDAKIIRLLNYYSIPFTRIQGTEEAAGIIRNQLLGE